MKILIDLQSCQSGSRLGGIGRYSMSLAKAMIRQGVGHEFFVLLNRALPAENEVRDQLRAYLPQHKILSLEIPSGIAEAHAKTNDDLARTRLAELIRERFISDLRPDAVHVSSLFEGLGEDVVTSVGLIFPESRTAVTLYDLIPLVDRERYLTNHVLEGHYLGKIKNIRKAGMLLAISEYSRWEGVEHGGFEVDRVVNISSAVDDAFKPRKVTPERRDSLFRQFGICHEFLMYIGSFDSRKNQARLIEAFSCLSENMRSAYQLVIVGNGWNGVYDELRGLARSFGLSDNSVLFPGHIRDDELLDLYSLCTLFVFPSLREGFGLPVLEAMSCGVPTIGSNTTSVPEVLGLAEAMFDPSDVSSIAAKIEQALTDHDFREALKTHATKHAKNFSWDISANKALKFIEKTIANIESKEKNHADYASKSSTKTYIEFLSQSSRITGISKADNYFISSASLALAKNELIVKQVLYGNSVEPKIGWVTTWNTRCGIATYTQHLAENAGCIKKVFAPINQKLIAQDGNEVERCWSFDNDDLMGLSDAIDRSGVEVVAIQMNHGFFDFPSLGRLITRQKSAGRIVTVTLHATVDPPPSILNRRLADLASALKACDGILVHSLADVVNLEKIDIVQNVVLFPQGVVKPSEQIQMASHKNKVFTVSTYGFFLPHKGLEQVIEAIALLRDKSVEVDLVMVNAEYSPQVSGHLIQRCQSLIESRGLTSHVRMITEYLDEQDALSRLAASDLVVYAYQGTSESSSAAVRMGLASGALVAVTPLAIFDDVQDYAIRLPGLTPSDLAKGIHEIMDKISENPHELNVTRNNAKRWVECHQFSHQSRYFSMLLEQYML